MAKWVLVIMACSWIGIGCNDDGLGQSSGYPPGYMPGLTPDAGAQGSNAGGPAMMTLAATSAQQFQRIGTSAPLPGNAFVRVGVSMVNTGEAAPLLVTPETLLLESSSLLYPGKMEPVDAAMSCPAAVEVERGGTLACQMTFELPRHPAVNRLVYADMMGRSAAAAITAVAPAPSLCDALTSSDCTDCVANRTGCSRRNPTVTQACTAAEQTCVRLSGCPQTGCTVSQACQDAVDDLDACYYEVCYSFCR